MTWRDNAACGRTNLPWLHPTRATGEETEAMIAVCATCPVRPECKADMQRHGDHVDVFRAGAVWGWSGRPRRLKKCRVCKLRFAPTSETTKVCGRACQRLLPARERMVLVRGSRLPASVVAIGKSSRKAARKRLEA